MQSEQSHILKAPCPKCGDTVVTGNRMFKCTNCDFLLRKTVSSRTFEPAEVEKLIKERRIGPLQGFLDKRGKPFEATLELNSEFKLEFHLGSKNPS